MYVPESVMIDNTVENLENKSTNVSRIKDEIVFDLTITYLLIKLAVLVFYPAVIVYCVTSIILSTFSILNFSGLPIFICLAVAAVSINNALMSYHRLKEQDRIEKEMANFTNE